MYSSKLQESIKKNTRKEIHKRQGKAQENKNTSTVNEQRKMKGKKHKKNIIITGKWVITWKF